MSVRKILKMGRELLLEQSEPITQFDTQQLHALVADLIETMEHAQGAGLAAPQIGVLKRVVVFGYEPEQHPDAPDVPLTVLINPVITPLSDEFEESWEGCLSLPGMRGAVPRYARIRYEGFDQYGRAISRQASGFHARVVQHECDHLDGILYPMRMLTLDNFGFNDAFEEDDALYESQAH